MTPRLSIIIVNFNGARHLENCLAIARCASASGRHRESIVVDNASTRRQRARSWRGYAGVRLIQLAANVGFSAGNNAGIRATSGEFVLLLNNDTLVPAGALDRLVARLEAHAAAAVAGPRLVDGDGAPSCRSGR